MKSIDLLKLINGKFDNSGFTSKQVLDLVNKDERQKCSKTLWSLKQSGSLDCETNNGEKTYTLTDKAFKSLKRKPYTRKKKTTTEENFLEAASNVMARNTELEIKINELEGMLVKCLHMLRR